MSIERELLKKVVQDASEGTMSLSLYNEIMDYLDQPEEKREPLSDEEIILAYRGLVKRAIGRFQKTKPAHGIGGGE